MRGVLTSAPRIASLRRFVVQRRSKVTLRFTIRLCLMFEALAHLTAASCHASSGVVTSLSLQSSFQRIFVGRSASCSSDGALHALAVQGYPLTSIMAGLSGLAMKMMKLLPDDGFYNHTVLSKSPTNTKFKKGDWTPCTT